MWEDPLAPAARLFALRGAGGDWRVDCAARFSRSASDYIKFRFWYVGARNSSSCSGRGRRELPPRARFRSIAYFFWITVCGACTRKVKLPLLPLSDHLCQGSQTGVSNTRPARAFCAAPDALWEFLN